MEEDNEEFFIKLAKHFQKPLAEQYPIINATFEQNEELLETLLESHPANETTEEGISALWCSCYVGSSSCLELLLKSNANPDVADSVRQTPLFVAAYQGSEENVKLLLDNGASLYQQDYLERTVLHAAADAGNSKIISTLLEFERDHQPPQNIEITPLIAFQDKEGRSALHYAAIGNQCDCVDSLIAGGANVDQTDSNLATPLHLASEIGHDYVVDILIDDNANMEALDNQGRTALHIACTEGRGYCVDLLIANGAEIMVLDGKGLSPLHLAVLNGQTEIVKLLLDGAEVDSVDEDGNEVPYRNAARPNVKDSRERTCMHAAAELGDVVLCELLHQRGTDIHMLDDEGRSPLHYCGMWSQAGCVDWFLIKGIDVDIRDNSDRTCLHYASYFGNYQVVHTLLRRSADVNASDSKADTPLLCALHEYDNNDKSEIIQLLLEYGANILQTNDYQRNSIHVCSCTGDVETIELLLDQSCNEDTNWTDTDGSSAAELINFPDMYGLTPVHISAANSQYDVLEFLIQQGGNPNLQDKAGSTPLHWACRSGSIDCIDILVNQFRVNTTIRDNQGQTCLGIAAYAGAKDCIRSLLEVGLSPMDRDRTGRTPLHGACFNGHTVILNMFLGCSDIQLDYVCNMGRTALHRASARGHLEIVKILLSNEGSVDVADGKGTSPLMLATFYGHSDVAKYLIESGANPELTDKQGRTLDDYLARGQLKGHLDIISKVPTSPRDNLLPIDSMEFITIPEKKVESTATSVSDSNEDSSCDSSVDPIVVTHDVEVLPEQMQPEAPETPEPADERKELINLDSSVDSPKVEEHESEFAGPEPLPELEPANPLEETPAVEEPVADVAIIEEIPNDVSVVPESQVKEEPEKPVIEDSPAPKETFVVGEMITSENPIGEQVTPILESQPEKETEPAKEEKENAAPKQNYPADSNDFEEESESEEDVLPVKEQEPANPEEVKNNKPAKEEPVEDIIENKEEKENLKPVEKDNEEEDSWVAKVIDDLKQPSSIPTGKPQSRDIIIEQSSPNENEVEPAPRGFAARLSGFILSLCSPIFFLFARRGE